MSEKTNTHFGLSVVTMVIVVGVIALILGLTNSIYGGGRAGSADLGEAAVEARIKPAGQLNVGEPIVVAAAEPAAAEPAAARSGDDVYNSSCMACHAAGIAGAPKLGEHAAWNDRLAKGLDTLVQHAIDGFQGDTGVMPPRGTCGTCSDDELKAAVEYMLSQLD